MSATTDRPAWADRNRRSRNTDWTLATFISRWEDQLKSPETRRKYVPYFEAFVTWMERYSDYTGIDILREAGVEELEDYFTYLQSPHWDGHDGDCTRECRSLPYDLPSLKAKRDALSAAFSYAGVHQLRRTNPVLAIKLDPRTRKQRLILLPDEILAVVDAARGRSWKDGFLPDARQAGLRAAVTTALFFGAGLRCEEVQNIDVENLYTVPRGRMLRFKRKGQNKWADIDIPHRVAALIDEHLAGRTEGPLIMSTRRRTRNKETGELEHTRLDSSGLYRMVQAAGAACGFKLGPHDGRATSITLALVDPAQPSHDRIMAYYGHESFSTTMIYRHASRLPAGHHKNPYGIDWTTQAP
ncbi:tyrosine-type recombinase/integrase [Streptomyces werraensis]|uniref:tyrosine-type recombinase/integrase n=1 Tax=Streptomyces werraensis TaxID=68284 RepID=UPI003449A7D1